MARVRRDPNDLPIPEKILQAATSLFSRMGYDNTPMSLIAEEAGITPGALYYHFANKQDIIFRTLERAALELGSVCISAAAAATDPLGKLRAFVEADVRYQLTSLDTIAPVYTGLVYGARRRDDLLTKDQLARLRDLELRHLDALRAILEEGIRRKAFAKKPVTLTAFAIIGMCEHVVNWHKPTGALSPVQIARFFADQAQIVAEQPSPVHALRAARPKRERPAS
jgi:AcrR family transcriptional regulator